MILTGRKCYPLWHVLNRGKNVKYGERFFSGGFSFSFVVLSISPLCASIFTSVNNISQNCWEGKMWKYIWKYLSSQTVHSCWNVKTLSLQLGLAYWDSASFKGSGFWTVFDDFTLEEAACLRPDMKACCTASSLCSFWQVVLIYWAIWFI